MERKARKLAERYEEVLPPDKLKDIEQLELPLYHFVSGFAFPELPVVTRDGIALYEWGLIPPWVKDTQGAREIRIKTLNAVGETVFEKPSFRKSIAKQRGLLPVNGFFEWREFNKAKYPYLVRVKGEEIFSLGCIYETWVDKSTGEVHRTFSILTTPANPLMEKIHNLKKRMPLILNRADEANWVDQALSTEDIIKLIRPFDESKMEAWTVSKLVNNSRNNRNVPEIAAPVDYPELEKVD